MILAVEIKEDLYFPTTKDEIRVSTETLVFVIVLLSTYYLRNSGGTPFKRMFCSPLIAFNDEYFLFSKIQTILFTSVQFLTHKTFHRQLSTYIPLI